MSLSRSIGAQDSSPRSSSQQVIELLNNAQMSSGDNSKLDSLKIVQEIVIHQAPDMLDNFLDEILAFQRDRSQEIRKFVVAFIEEACKKEAELLPKVITNLQMLLGDDAVAVQKRVIQAMTQLYRSTLRWLSQASSISDRMEATWGLMLNIKDVIVQLIDSDNDGIRTHALKFMEIVQLIDSDNDGIRTHALKFMEMIVLTQTHREPESAFKENDFCLDDVPLGLKMARPRKLEEDARRVFDEMVKYHGSAHISSANLMTCMGSLANIAKLRPEFMSKVITALEMLHANLPPTLAKSQVSSVRKHLKNQLLILLKHRTAAEHFFTNITTLLTDLGASRDEVMKAMPQYEEMKRMARKKEREALKAPARAEEEATEAKRQKIDIADDEEEDEEEEDEDMEKRTVVPTRNLDRMESVVDITEKFVFEQLKNPSFAAELVLVSMGLLPEEIPPHFNNTYTPIAAAGTETQVRHVSRLLAAQLTNAGLGPGVLAMKRQRAQMLPEGEQEDEEESSGQIPTVGGGEGFDRAVVKAPVKLTPAGLTQRHGRKGQAALKLSDITKPLSQATRKMMIVSAIQRILKSERAARVGGIPDVRIKIITSLAASFSQDARGILLDFIFEDIHSRADLAFGWLYEEYCFYQGFNRSSNIFNRKPGDITAYSDILCALISDLNFRPEVGLVDRDVMMRRLYLESPIITSDAINLLKQFCQEPGRALAVVTLMKDLVLKRPVKQLNFLNSILEFCSHEDAEVRDMALSTVLSLYDRGELASIIEEYSVMFLKFLLLARPPDMLFGDDRGRPIVASSWTEEIIKVCLNLYLAILPRCKKLLSVLAEVYVGTGGDIKRTILRIIDTPIREIGMESPELLSLVENCPKGSETLITRIIHILTEKSTPSAELVDKVRELNKRRVADVRFLIPVLTGLTRPEILDALPKLIKLNPVVVKEVFNRLLGASTNGMTGVMSASELLIALHNIDPTQCDMKTVIKSTAICFQDRSVYTMEVLTIVLQQLMEQKDIPLLFMRTVIQAVTLNPHLIGFTMNILQRLIVKQVWKQKPLWEGFIRCCQRTQPQSFTILLQLPPPQLISLLAVAADIRGPLLEHVQSFTEAQKQHVPAAILDVLMNPVVPQSEDQSVEVKTGEDQET